MIEKFLPHDQGDQIFPEQVNVQCRRENKKPKRQLKHVMLQFSRKNDFF